jgi:DNA mismatch endonuclease (patch repair protein)
MVDVLTPEQRRLNMSRIRGKDTKPELLLRRGLHALGLRYRLHCKDLPGRPDIVFPRYRVAVLVHGCFWHGHDCPLFKLPATRREFWQAKIEGNRARDGRDLAALAAAGWSVLVVWECALKGPARRPEAEVLQDCATFVKSHPATGEIAGAHEPDSIRATRRPSDTRNEDTSPGAHERTCEAGAGQFQGGCSSYLCQQTKW